MFNICTEQNHGRIFCLWYVANMTDLPATTRGLISKLKELELALRAEGVEKLAIFGSRARGDAHLESDVDLLLDVTDEPGFSILNIVGVEQIVADKIKITANAFLRRSLDEHFWRSIQADVIRVF